MNIREISALKSTAGERLANAKDARKIALIFGGLNAGLALLVTGLSFYLDMQIGQTGGLRNIGIRSALASVQPLLSIVQVAALMCLELGYLAAMLRISRGQYTSPQTLRAGIQRFFPLLRMELLQILIYLGIAMIAGTLSVQFFMLTPMSDGLMNVLTPILGSGTEQEAVAMLGDEKITMLLMREMVPCYLLMLAVFAAAAIPVAYRYRMARYVLLDKPAVGAVAALRESRRMMRKNGIALFRLDVSFWWYYGVNLLAAAVCYGDTLLGFAGIRLPWSGNVSYFLFYGLYLVVTLVSCVFLRNRVEVTYAEAYDAVRPKEQTEGVVLGNIFQM